MTQETAVEISDEVVRQAWITFDGQWFSDRENDESMQRMRSTLRAAIPLVVEELVGSPSDFLKHIDDGYPKGFREGSNARRQDILAKVKK